MSEKLHELKKSSSFTSASGHNPSSFRELSNGISLILNFAQLFRFRVAIIAALAGCATIYALFD